MKYKLIIVCPEEDTIKLVDTIEAEDIDEAYGIAGDTHPLYFFDNNYQHVILTEQAYQDLGRIMHEEKVA